MSKDRLEEFTLEELERELARRRSAQHNGPLRDFEVAAEKAQRERTRAELQAFLNEKADTEDDAAKPCPQCGRLCRVRARDRSRNLRAVSGDVSFRRNYHYCKECVQGFYPLDDELELPEHGNLTREMERRVLDFGVTDTFEEAASRWSVHYSEPISPNLVRRVIERQGKCLDEADHRRVYEAALAPRATPPERLMVYVDGSMVLTREGWREVKLAVIVRDDQHLPGTQVRRGIVTEARYVAHLGSVDEFRERLDAALEVAGARDATRVLWLGDGAKWIWNLRDEICPQADQLLDWRHLQEVSHACAQTLFGAEKDCVEIWGERVGEVLWQEFSESKEFIPNEFEEQLSDIPLDQSNDTEHIIALDSYRHSGGTPLDLPGSGSSDAPAHVAQLLEELDECWGDASSSTHRGALETFSRYVHHNRHRMDYHVFREREDPTGSGTGESAHKHVIQARMKRAGQHWDAANADRMAQLRAAYRTSGPQRFYDVIRTAAA